AHVQRLFAGGREDMYETVGVDGVRRLYATVVVDAGFPPNLFMSVGMDTASALAEANRIAVQQIWVLGLLALIVIGTAMVGGHTLIVRPVNALRSVTKRLAAGDL